MRVSAQKSTFFKKSVSFLGFVVTNNGAATDPEKAGQAKAIREFPEPTNVFEVRSFLGLASINSETHFKHTERGKWMCK